MAWFCVERHWTFTEQWQQRKSPLTKRATPCAFIPTHFIMAQPRLNFWTLSAELTLNVQRRQPQLAVFVFYQYLNALCHSTSYICSTYLRFAHKFTMVAESQLKVRLGSIIEFCLDSNLIRLILPQSFSKAKVKVDTGRDHVALFQTKYALIFAECWICFGFVWPVARRLLFSVWSLGESFRLNLYFKAHMDTYRTFGR